MASTWYRSLTKVLSQRAVSLGFNVLLAVGLWLLTGRWEAPGLVALFEFPKILALYKLERSWKETGWGKL